MPTSVLRTALDRLSSKGYQYVHASKEQRNQTIDAFIENTSAEDLKRVINLVHMKEGDAYAIAPLSGGKPLATITRNEVVETTDGCLVEKGKEHLHKH